MTEKTKGEVEQASEESRTSGLGGLLTEKISRRSFGKLLGAGKRLLTGESFFITLFGNSAAVRRDVAFATTRTGLVAVAEPPALVAVTETASLRPASAAVSR